MQEAAALPPHRTCPRPNSAGSLSGASRGVLRHTPVPASPSLSAAPRRCRCCLRGPTRGPPGERPGRRTDPSLSDQAGGAGEGGRGRTRATTAPARAAAAPTTKSVSSGDFGNARPLPPPPPLHKGEPARAAARLLPARVLAAPCPSPPYTT